MAYLKNGVLAKLLEEMEMEEKDFDEPVLLQIRSIIPVLEEGDLWPNRGFFLKVSDMSHQMFVSLPQEQDEMILGNKLKLGQFVYVQKLEKASPVPVIRGITPIPGRHPCEGVPEDIASPSKVLKFFQASTEDSIVEKGVILEKKISESSSDTSKLWRGLSDTESLRKGSEGMKDGSHRRIRSLSSSKAPKCVMLTPFIEKKSDIVYAKGQKNRPSSPDVNSDSDRVTSSGSSTCTSKRRSWTYSDILKVKEFFDPSVVKHETKPQSRSCSKNASSVRSLRYDSSDDNPSSTSRRRDVSSAKKAKVSNKCQTPVSKVNNVQMPNSLVSLVYDRKGAETGISWSTLPTSLVKLGKEVVKQRDVALLAAADALQEACAAERLLKSLSTFSEFHSAAGEDLQPYVDKFFDLQDDLSHTRLIMQSLTNISPVNTSETEYCVANSVKETLKTAVERKKNAATWIKSAVALDLSSHCATLSPMPNTMAASNMAKKSSTSNRGTKPKGACIIQKNRSSADLPVVLSSDRDDQHEWTKGSTLSASVNLAVSLQDECRQLFMSCIEKYLDKVERKSSSMESDGHMAGMMYKVKRVSDWLDMNVHKEGNPQNDGCQGDSCNLEDSGVEAYGRVRNKIYGILMQHVERAAMAYASANA